MPVVPFIPLIASGISAVASVSSGNAQRRAASRAAAAGKIERDEQNAILEVQKQEYRDIKFTNPYEGMENAMEDLTVNQQQAQFQSQQGNQQRKDIMHSMRGAAGGSGIAGLAQAMANQGQLQTQRISASIGSQEARNQGLAAGEASRIQTLERQGDMMVQEAESGRQATLLGVQQGGVAGSNASYQQLMSNKDSANSAANAMNVNAITGLASAAAQTDWPSLSSGGGDDDWQSFYPETSNMSE